MKKVLLLSAVVVLALASFTTINNQKTVLKDIEGTLLESYVVVDKAEKKVTFSVDANTTVASSVIDDELRIFLVENGSSDAVVEHTLTTKEASSLSFDSYFEASADVASNGLGSAAFIDKQKKPRTVME